MALDSLELQLVSAVQRYNNLQRRSEQGRDTTGLLSRTLAELSTALEELRVAQENLVENRLHMERMNAELAAQAAKYWELFDESPQAYLLTDARSTITEVNKAGAQLFNVSQRFLVGKTMSVFVCESRTHFLEQCSRLAAEAATETFTLRLRPRERAALEVRAKARGEANRLRWILEAVTPAATGPSVAQP